MTATAPASFDAQAGRAASSRELLDPERERELALRYREGDVRAFHRLVESNIGFVATIAREYRRWGIPLEDLVQQGTIGLMKAIERFDPERGHRLVTYAGYWIRAEIREYVVRGYRIVRMGTTKREKRALRHYRTKREDDPERLAEASGLSREEVERLLPLLSGREASLDAPNAMGMLLGDRIAGSEPSPEERLVRDDWQMRTRAAIDEVLSELVPRERLIARSRWFLDDPVTLEQLGRELGISKERVRQLEARMLARLRDRLRHFDDGQEDSPADPSC